MNGLRVGQIFSKGKVTQLTFGDCRKLMTPKKEELCNFNISSVPHIKYMMRFYSTEFEYLEAIKIRLSFSSNE